MKPTRRWIRTVLAQSAMPLPSLPWQRGWRKSTPAPLPALAPRAATTQRS